MSDDPPFATDHPHAGLSVSSMGTAREALPVYRQIPASPSTQPADLELSVSIELGRVRMRLADVMQLESGLVLELDRLAADPVDIVINDQLVARGEVVVLNDRFAVRIVQVMPANSTRE